MIYVVNQGDYIIRSSKVIVLNYKGKKYEILYYYNNLAILVFLVISSDYPMCLFAN